jgi:hypothetical protein
VREVDLLFFDTTSTYFERDEPERGEGAFRVFGHSKDHRPDLPQIVIGLAVRRSSTAVRHPSRKSLPAWRSRARQRAVGADAILHRLASVIGTRERRRSWRDGRSEQPRRSRWLAAQD